MSYWKRNNRFSLASLFWGIVFLPGMLLLMFYVVVIYFWCVWDDWRKG